MASGNASRRSTRRWYLIASYVLVVAYIATLSIATDKLWRRNLVHDAGTLGAYSTAVLAISTTVLFAVTAVLAAATIELVRTEREAARREEEKYGQERQARIQEDRLRDERLKVYSLQLVDLQRRLDVQERAQAELVVATSAVVTVGLPTGTAARYRVLRVENRSHLPIRRCEPGIDVVGSAAVKPKAGTISGALTDSITRFSEKPAGIVLMLRSDETVDFVVPEEHAPEGVPVLFVEFDDAHGRRWRLDGEQNLSRHAADPGSADARRPQADLSDGS